MRRIAGMMALVMTLVIVLSGCGLLGKKDASAVVKDLDKVIEKLDSYQGTGSMVLHTGQQPQEYGVEVWYQNPHYYRISLTNEKKDITQIVLKNDDGVFVLTPHLNKSFRFQSEWPENQGQVYLFQSLAQSILMDNDRQFTTDDKGYVFDVLANYQNGSLARQKIWLDRKSLAPKQVDVMDSNANVMVQVSFDQFQFGAKFDKDSFDMQRNMSAAATMSQQPVAVTKVQELDAKGAGTLNNGAKPEAAPVTGPAIGGVATAPKPGTVTQPDAKATGAAPAPSAKPSTGAATTAPAPAQKSQAFGIIEPNYLPKGVAKLGEIAEVKLGEEKGVMIRYSGKYNFNLVESKPLAHTATSMSGDLIDLGYTFGVLTGDTLKTLTWMSDSIEFRLSSGDLTSTEMIKIAQSVQGQMGK